MNKKLKKFTTQELDEELSWRREADRRLKIINSIKNLSISGFKVKNILVIYKKSDYKFDGEKESYDFSFYLIHNKKAYDIYYHFENQKWWPRDKNLTFDANCANEYVPEYFYENSENVYGFDGTAIEATNLLKECGYLEKNIEYQSLNFN